jgi:hypothetical protein
MLLTVFLFIVGIGFPLLLNGQTFTNSIVGIVFLCATVIRCVVLERRADVDDKIYVSRRVVASLAVLVMVIVSLQLPANYERQNRFNRGVETFRQAEHRLNFPTSSQILHP